MISQQQQHWDTGSGWPAIAAVMTLHVLALWGLLQIQVVHKAVFEAAPIMVRLISVATPKPAAALPEAPPPKTVPVKPERQPKPKARIIASRLPRPAPMAAPLAPKPVDIQKFAPPAETASENVQEIIVPPNFIAAYLDNPAPQYPRRSKKLRETGTVLLRVSVDHTGNPVIVAIESSSGHRRLDLAALNTVRQWKFVPARKADRAISAQVLVPIDFELTQKH